MKLITLYANLKVSIITIIIMIKQLKGEGVVRD